MAALLTGPQPVSDREFRAYQAWVLRETGIHLTDAKRQLLVGRLWRRVKELGLQDYGAYLRLAAEGDDPEERTRLINALCTHETQFFREPRQFEHLDQVLFPRWKREGEAGLRSRQIRVWSAASSSGEEPYSVAMALLAHFPAAEGWHAEVLATDLSSAVLERAEAGVYPMTRAAQIPEGYLKRFMRLRSGSYEEVLVSDLMSVTLDLAAVKRGYRRPAGLGYAIAATVSDPVLARTLHP